MIHPSYTEYGLKRGWLALLELGCLVLAAIFSLSLFTIVLALLPVLAFAWAAIVLLGFILAGMYGFLYWWAV